jgi:hypothetical protein
MNKMNNNTNPFYEEEDETIDPDWCEECHGRGKVTTSDYESYFGASYKPCPICGGDPCYSEPPTPGPIRRTRHALLIDPL